MKKNSIGQGHGVKGRFAGLTDTYCNASRSQIVIVPVEFDKTSTYLKGSRKGPAALIEASRNVELYDIESNSEVYTKGIYTDRPIKASTSKKMIDFCFQRVQKHLTQNKFVVTVGGEHTVAYPSILAHAQHFKKLTILHLDAHADLQDSYEGNPWSHASVMARVKEIPEIKNVVSIGIRSMSSEEIPNMDINQTFFAHKLEGKWIDNILKKLSGPIYITFDLDVFDSSLMPSTGTPEPGGLTWNQAMTLLKRVSEKCNIVGFDVVELCPNKNNPAPDYVAAKLIYKLLSYIFCNKDTP